jgi:hypothetical protein
MSSPSRVEEIFGNALEKATAGERAAYLDEACRGDPELRRAVERLLEAHPHAGGFLEKPALAPPTVAGSAEAPTLGPSADPAGIPSVGTKVRYFGDYELLDEIARGGMGRVFRARQVSLSRTVALKVILSGQFASPQEIQRFHREAEAAANLDHPNIVPIYEVGEVAGQHYFSMKLIEGPSLASRVSDFVRDPRATARLLAKVARAVHEAHQHAVLHRDLKPHNILLDAQGEPYVADFGLAKHVDGRGTQTHSGLIVGTPSYMAPEQARAEKSLTVAVDVYSLGAILYELLTGRSPFGAASDLETLLQVLEREPVMPRTVKPGVDQDLEAICLKCLEKDPRKRYVSALAFAEDLGRWLAGQPIEARSINPARRIIKWVKRNPQGTTILALLALWYFNVRLPWHWAWLGWGLLAITIGLGLLRFLLQLLPLVRWLSGKSPGGRPSVDVDPGLALGTVAALLVLCFYSADLAAREGVAFRLFATIFLLGHIIRWLYRRRRAGLHLVALRPPLVFASFFVLLLVLELPVLVVAGNTDDVFPLLISGSFTISSTLYFLCLLVAGVEMREGGCVTFYRAIGWQEIESCEWRPSAQMGLLRLRLKVHKGLDVAANLVQPAKRELVEQILREYLPPGATTGLAMPVDVIGPGREQVNRVKESASLLLLTGFLQVMGAFPFLNPIFWALEPVLALEWENRFWNPIVLLLVAAGATCGFVVIVGALRMRERRSYRLCRISSVLTMLPLGFAFLLGLPAGIWSLLVLRRPEVRAAFLSNEGTAPLED